MEKKEREREKYDWGSLHTLVLHSSGEKYLFYLLYIMKILNFSNLWIESKFVLW